MIKIGRRGSLNAVIVASRRAGPRRLSRTSPTIRSRAWSRCSPALAARPARRRHAALPAVDADDHLDRRRQPGDQRHSGEGAAPGSTSASTTCTPADDVRAWLQRRIDAAGGRCDLRTECSGEAFLTAPGRLSRGRGRGGARGDRQDAGTQHLGRHLGRPLHQGRLPGGRIRHARRDAAQGRRERPRSTTSSGSPPFTTRSSTATSPIRADAGLCRNCRCAVWRLAAAARRCPGGRLFQQLGRGRLAIVLRRLADRAALRRADRASLSRCGRRGDAVPLRDRRDHRLHHLLGVLSGRRRGAVAADRPPGPVPGLPVHLQLVDGRAEWRDSAACHPRHPRSSAGRSSAI